MILATIGGEPDRIDLEVYPGDPVDFTIPVLDATGAAESALGWAVAAQVRASPAAALLHAFTVAAAAGGIRVSATADETAAWSDWPVSVARWDLRVTPPGGDPALIVAGWVRVHSVI